MEYKIKYIIFAYERKIKCVKCVTLKNIISNILLH